MPRNILNDNQISVKLQLSNNDLCTSTTAVCPVNIVLASTTLCSLGVALISHRHIV